MSNAQKWEDSSAVGKHAVIQVKDFLHSTPKSKLWFSTILIHDVQDEPKFQPLGVDLLWFVKTYTGLCCVTLEVKGDRNYTTGNFFIETISNIKANTQGAFLSTQAEWYCYYYLDIEELYFIPMIIAKPWFLNNTKRFKERQASSTRGSDNWKTKGSLVPRHILLQEVEGVKVFKRKNERWTVSTSTY